MINNAHSIIRLYTEKIKDCYVLVIGDVMLDKYCAGDIKRISPEAPVPIINMKEEKKILGGAANVANNLSNLGCMVSLVGGIGRDSGGDDLLNLLEYSKIENSGILISEQCTTIKTRIISGNQQVLRIDHEEKMELNNYMFNQFSKWFQKELESKKIDVIIISDYDKGFCSEELCKLVISKANSYNIPIIVDPKADDWSKYTNATIITPNLKELSASTGNNILNLNEEINKYGPFIRNKYNLDYLLITRSEKGMSLVEEGDIYHFPTLAKEIYDVSGAGDTVVSTIAAFIAIGVRMDEAVKISNIAAGIAVGKLGTHAIRDTELIEQLELMNEEKIKSKVTSKQELVQLINRWRTRGDKIVFTNGCFDLLHIGHATYLREARQFGDKLIVGLNSDNSVKRLKGSSRPIVNERNRAQMLSFFEFVDAVCIFDEETPLELLAEVKPDILVKGGDYILEEVVGREFAKTVEIISYIDGYSTSRIIEDISYKLSLKTKIFK